MRELQAEAQAQQPPPQQGQEGVPTPDNPSGTGAGNLGPGNAPEPGSPGFSANTGEGQEPTVQ